MEVSDSRLWSLSGKEGQNHEGCAPSQQCFGFPGAAQWDKGKLQMWHMCSDSAWAGSDFCKILPKNPVWAVCEQTVRRGVSQAESWSMCSFCSLLRGVIADPGWWWELGICFCKLPRRVGAHREENLWSQIEGIFSVLPRLPFYSGSETFFMFFSCRCCFIESLQIISS